MCVCVYERKEIFVNNIQHNRVILEVLSSETGVMKSKKTVFSAIGSISCGRDH